MCEREIRGAADSYITSCQNEYHKKCIESHFKGSDYCPVCLLPCRPAGSQTRAKGMILERSEASQAHLEEPSSWLHMERRLLTTLSEKLVELVQSSV